MCLVYKTALLLTGRGSCLIVGLWMQGLALSVAEPSALPNLHHKQGVTADGLLAVVVWWRDAFKLLSGEEAARKVRMSFSAALQAKV